MTLKYYFEKNFNNAQLWEFNSENVELLVELVNLIRPKNPKTVTAVDLSELISLLKENENYRNGLMVCVNAHLEKKKFNKILSDAGILQDANFFFEVRKRIFAKLIPEQPEKDTLQFILNQIFFVNTDPIWIKKIPQEQILELFYLLKFHSIYGFTDENSSFNELIFAMEVITYRICGSAMETDVIQMVPEYENLESPFIAFQRELLLMNEKLIDSPENAINEDDLGYKQLIILHKQCVDYIETAFKNSNKFGISLHVNQSLLRIRQQLQRLKSLLPLLIQGNQEDAKRNTISLAYKLIKYNCDKNNIQKLVNESTQLLSYEITQHTANTGEHYITNSRKEYYKMFYSAAGGGFIVGILCIIKLLLGKVEASGFGHVFLYSMNYSIGFIIIYILGFTLATKQPAMTASALVRALQEGFKQKTQDKKDYKYKEFAIFFARVFRSQFIAFVGNVIIAFPVSLLGIWLIDQTFHYNIAKEKWPTLMQDLNPIYSAAIFHAAIAGVFLFLSGIIAGSIANRDKHNHIYYRIQEHPLLKLSLGKKWTKKLASLYEKKWAGIISNFWFGVFMGSTAFIGIFFGLNIDIRHITFASGNFALALYGTDFYVTQWMFIWSVLGIGIIGLVNFMVSFSLSLGLAFRSRNIPLSELRQVARAIFRYFLSKPMHFFFPPKNSSISQ
ncbi:MULTISPECIES: site-specific recombinase [unclassified Flavobacterium]|uniref:site-specific recombinase n=1 Tax=unclassified Flavobacterium TaxID=196869 RepID=UPI001F0A2919|nr:MULTISPECIES: site-specific recombinase [unclassified Flavobacterium]MEA9412763.1 site-specific recombinase [Flavobacterium sp. PL02]